jgi:hypothetical protein
MPLRPPFPLVRAFPPCLRAVQDLGVKYTFATLSTPQRRQLFLRDRFPPQHQPTPLPHQPTPPQHHPTPPQHHPTPPRHYPLPPAVRDARPISVTPPAPLLLPRLFLRIRSLHQIHPPSALQAPLPGFRRPRTPTSTDPGAQTMSATPSTPLRFPRPLLLVRR